MGTVKRYLTKYQKSLQMLRDTLLHVKANHAWSWVVGVQVTQGDLLVTLCFAYLLTNEVDQIGVHKTRNPS